MSEVIEVTIPYTIINIRFDGKNITRYDLQRPSEAEERRLVQEAIDRELPAIEQVYRDEKDYP